MDTTKTPKYPPCFSPILLYCFSGLTKDPRSYVGSRLLCRGRWDIIFFSWMSNQTNGFKITHLSSRAESFAAHKTVRMTHFTNFSFYFPLFWRLGVSVNWNYSHTTYSSSIACPFSWLREGGKRNFWPWPECGFATIFFFACIGQRGTCETYINFVYMEVATTGDTVGGANGLTFQNNKMKPSPNKFISDTFAKHAALLAEVKTQNVFAPSTLMLWSF